MTRDIKTNLIAKLTAIESGLTEGSEQWYLMRDVIDSLLSKSVKVKQTVHIDTRRPGDVRTAEELVLNNVD
jgi:hypothetical protein